MLEYPRDSSHEIICQGSILFRLLIFTFRGLVFGLFFIGGFFFCLVQFDSAGFFALSRLRRLMLQAE